MEFDFLTRLPSSNLDDRSFDDLVNECKLRIPRYCPEWTDHNISDPGVTLIELFAWLTDQMLLRFNQVPRKNYVAFLELLGIRLQPPTPAHTNLTFYLTAGRPAPYTIREGIEVATARTASQEPIIFRIDRELKIGQPCLRHVLTSRIVENTPEQLVDLVSGDWDQQNEANWSGREKDIFEREPQEGNTLYLGLEPDEALAGNVLSITFRGPVGSPTNIDPNRPPRDWQAWNGETWETVLMSEYDDKTKGFSFYQRNPGQGADVILHLPREFPEARFTGFSGSWVRCVVTEANQRSRQYPYNQSPRISEIAVRSIGGTVPASQCTALYGEALGTSDGNPGQTFQLQQAPVLERIPDQEYLQVEPPNKLPERWIEVADFADSGPNDRHYTLDSRTGMIQFGPLIREPKSLVQHTQDRQRLQRALPPPPNIHPELPEEAERRRLGQLERQYGAIPPPGATLTMVRYRTGGGKKGNVAPETLCRLRSSVPYVNVVTNREQALYGADGESLEEAVLRAPAILRSRDRAVTAEDFKALTLEAGGKSIKRVRCLTPSETDLPGTVRLLIVPDANPEDAQNQGISPEQLVLSPDLRQQINHYLDQRRLLGIRTELTEPDYVGVQVRTQVKFRPEYENQDAEGQVLSRLRSQLYNYLNPLTGGEHGQGWSFGQPVYASDIIAMLQRTSEILYVGRVRLYEIRKQGDAWLLPQVASSEGRALEGECVDPGPLGLICSWSDRQLRSGHRIEAISDQ